MNWGLFFLVVPMVCYVAQAAWYWAHGDQPHAVTFLAYAAANAGFVWGLLR